MRIKFIDDNFIIGYRLINKLLNSKFSLVRWPMLSSKIQKVSHCSSSATSLLTKTSALPSKSPRFDQCFLTLLAIEDSICSFENAEDFFALNFKLCLHHSQYKCFDSFTSFACLWPGRFIQTLYKLHSMILIIYFAEGKIAISFFKIRTNNFYKNLRQLHHWKKPTNNHMSSLV